MKPPQGYELYNRTWSFKTHRASVILLLASGHKTKGARSKFKRYYLWYATTAP